MSNAVALLRGMNVGGHRITNVELVEVFENLGLTGIMAYQASGNVLINIGDQETDDLERLLERGLAAALGYSVPTMVRTAPQIQAILEAAPYASTMHQPSGKPQIAFFKNPPSPRRAGEIEALAPSSDHLAVIGREVHWWPNGGVAESAIDWAAMQHTYGPFTMRTRGTIERIARKFTTN